MQLAVIEYARNVLEWSDAQSTEFNPTTTHPVVIEMPEHNPGQMGATMRLGKRTTVFKTSNSLLGEQDEKNDDLEVHTHEKFLVIIGFCPHWSTVAVLAVTLGLVLII